MSHSIRRLPDAELTVMQAVWASTPPVTRTEIQRHLPQPMVQTTLLTLLTRLAQKGFLTVTKDGRANCYTPVIERQAYLASQSRRFVDQLCGGSLSVLASALCDSGLTREELAELRRLLEEDAL
jgi:predicted transcriptional regulator